MKKAQGLALNTVVLAALALGVLVVMFFIFSGGANSFSKNLGDCKAKNGECAKGSDGSCPTDRPIKLYTSGCENVGTGDSKGLCCIKAPTS